MWHDPEGEDDDQSDQAGRDAHAKRASTIAPQAIIGTRLFQTIAMLVAIAVNASGRWSSSMGTENTLIAKPKRRTARRRAFHEQHCEAHGRRENSVDDMVQSRERPDTEEQRVDQNRRPHPENHQQAQEQTGEEDLRAGTRLNLEHSAHRRPLASFDCPALLIEPDRNDRPDDHEAGKGWKQDVVPPKREHRPNKDNRNNQNRKSIGQAEARPYHKSRQPATSQPNAAPTGKWRWRSGFRYSRFPIVRSAIRSSCQHRSSVFLAIPAVFSAIGIRRLEPARSGLRSLQVVDAFRLGGERHIDQVSVRPGEKQHGSSNFNSDSVSGIRNRFRPVSPIALIPSWIFYLQGIDIDCQDLNFRRGQPLVPCRHVPLASAVDRGDDLFKVAAIDPVLVGQIGRSHIRVALGVLAVTSGTVRQEHLPARLDRANVLGRGVPTGC